MVRRELADAVSKACSGAFIPVYYVQLPDFSKRIAASGGDHTDGLEPAQTRYSSCHCRGLSIRQLCEGADVRVISYLAIAVTTKVGVRAAPILFL